MKANDWTDVAGVIHRLLKTYAAVIPHDAAVEVRHYLDHDEYEMAFEGLCLELLKLAEFSPHDRLECLRLAQDLGLDRESVFDAEFWTKLSKSVEIDRPT